MDENGFISLPPAWEGKVTAGRLACVAHTWAMSSLVREDPEAAKARKTASARATMIPFFTALILLGMLAAGLLKFQIALAIGLACWAFFTFSALPTQFREWKAAEIAKSGLEGSRAVARAAFGCHGCGTMPESAVMVPRGRLPAYFAQIEGGPGGEAHFSG